MVYNPDLTRSVVIALNGRIEEQDRVESHNTKGGRGVIVDSGKKRWSIPRDGFSGIAGVYCFDTSPKYELSDVRQTNPTGIVEYIRTATRYDGKGLDRHNNPPGRYWTGSFSTIDPGKSIRVSVDYVPDSLLQPQNRNEKPSLAEWPEYFQIDIELVLGTCVDPTKPEGAKDLALRNLTIDRVNFPKSSLKE